MINSLNRADTFCTRNLWAGWRFASYNQWKNGSFRANGSLELNQRARTYNSKQASNPRDI